jgi:hypothetical protein|tara:strand:- start:179 stop:340 length:162 start_codon:yes stop_codon:yes gene_type:complete
MAMNPSPYGPVSLGYAIQLLFYVTVSAHLLIMAHSDALPLINKRGRSRVDAIN